MFCSKCGAQLQSGGKFCPSCGNSVTDETARGQIVSRLKGAFFSCRDFVKSTFSNPATRKKGFVALGAIGIVIIGFIMINSISPGVPGVNKMTTDLQSHPNFYSVQNVSISKLEIIKRQTNKDRKSDVVYVTVEASNENVNCVLSYQLTYNLYSQGWILDYIHPYSYGEWNVTPKKSPDTATANKYIAKEYSSYDFLTELVDLDKGTASFSYQADYAYTYMTQVRQVDVKFSFNSQTTEWEHIGNRITSTSETWDILGSWLAYDNKGSYSYYHYRMKITEMTDSSITVSVYNIESGELLFNDSVSFNPSSGTSFYATRSDWDNLLICIKPNQIDIVDTSGMLSKQNCLFVRE